MFNKLYLELNTEKTIQSIRNKINYETQVKTTTITKDGELLRCILHNDDGEFRINFEIDNYSIYIESDDAYITIEMYLVLYKYFNDEW